LGNFFYLFPFNFISVSLKSASKNGDSNIVEYLIKNGANLNINDTNGNTPLLSGTIKA
jgi:ankyrin repeat protein